jgi:CheY-like chemotaxis protein
MHRVLLIDDESDLLTSLSLLLEDVGYQVLIASDGTAALELLGSEELDSIVCDLRMPGMDGLQFCSMVRRNPDWKGIRLVVLTGFLDEASARQGLDIGVDRYLTKPFNLDDLLAAIGAE